jgi:hypothetical protein
MSILDQLRQRHDPRGHGAVRFSIGGEKLTPPAPAVNPVTPDERHRREVLAATDEAAYPLWHHAQGLDPSYPPDTT